MLCHRLGACACDRRCCAVASYEYLDIYTPRSHAIFLHIPRSLAPCILSTIRRIAIQLAPHPPSTPHMIEESIALKADLSRLAHILRHSPNAARPWHNLLTGDHTWRRRCCGALPFEKVDRPFNANNRHAIERRINNIRPFANALRALP